MGKKTAWFQERVEYIKGLKNPAPHRAQLLALMSQNSLSSSDHEKLAAIESIERAVVAGERRMAVLDSLNNPKTTVQRRLEGRQAAVLGKFLLTNEPATVERIKRLLISPKDRKVFGLEAVNSAPVAPATPVAKPPNAPAKPSTQTPPLPSSPEDRKSGLAPTVQMGFRASTENRPPSGNRPIQG